MLGPHRERFERVWSQVEAIPGWLDPLHGAGLFVALAVTRPETVVEIGSYLGRSTTLLALGLRELDIPGRVIAIDPHTGDRQHLERLGVERLPSYDLFRSHLLAVGIADRVETVVATSDEAAIGWERPIDLLFVDGWHTYDAVTADGVNFASHLTPHGVVVYDDAGHYAEIGRAVDDLAARGIHHLWGWVGAHRYAGSSPRPRPELARALRTGARTRRTPSG